MLITKKGDHFLKFRVNKRARTHTSFNIPKKDFDVARKFSTVVYKEFQNFISAITVFGSTVTKANNKNNDIDLLIILDDVRIVLDPDIIQTYRIIVEKAIIDTDTRIHVQTMRLTTFWEYVRAGDPVAINILRTSIAMIDSGFFDPLQALLDNGRIRPSKEAVYTYFTMAPKGLFKSKDHVLSAMLDLYWSCIDAAHALLMSMGEVPPSPSQVGDSLNSVAVKKGYLKKSHVKTIEDLYKISKQITHRETRGISGKEYDAHFLRAKDFVETTRRILERIWNKKK